MQFYLVDIITFAITRRLEEARSHFLYKESHVLQLDTIKRKLKIHQYVIVLRGGRPRVASITLCACLVCVL